MWEILANISITRKLIWHCYKKRISVFEEGIKIRFNFLFPHYKGREALKFVEQIVKEEKILWITLGHDRWTFDLDKMKIDFKDLSSIEWLKGKVSLEPEVISDTSNKIGSHGTDVSFYIIHEELGEVSKEDSTKQGYFKKLLKIKTETENIDFKERFNFNSAEKIEKLKLVKDILAMANTENGGKIVFGVKDKTFDFIGLSKNEYKSFDLTKINDLIQKYADPKFYCEIKKGILEKKYIVVIDIPEFKETPIICKKDGGSKGKQILERGDFYIRTKKASTEKISASEQMRDLLNRTVFKQIDRELLSLYREALATSRCTPPDKRVFEQKINEIELAGNRNIEQIIKIFSNLAEEIVLNWDEGTKLILNQLSWQLTRLGCGDDLQAIKEIWGLEHVKNALSNIVSLLWDRGLDAVEYGRNPEVVSSFIGLIDTVYEMSLMISNKEIKRKCKEVKGYILSSYRKKYKKDLPL